MAVVTTIRGSAPLNSTLGTNMDTDFYIEVVAQNGLRPLQPFLAESPFELTLATDSGSGELVLSQVGVSTVAGFWFNGKSSSTYEFGAAVSASAPGGPELVMKQLSSMLQKADLPHRISRIEQELDEDEEIIRYGL